MCSLQKLLVYHERFLNFCLFVLKVKGMEVCVSNNAYYFFEHLIIFIALKLYN